MSFTSKISLKYKGENYLRPKNPPVLSRDTPSTEEARSLKKCNISVDVPAIRFRTSGVSAALFSMHIADRAMAIAHLVLQAASAFSFTPPSRLVT